MEFVKRSILPFVSIYLKFLALVNKYVYGNQIPHPPERLLNWIFNNNLLSTLEYLTDVLFTYKIFRFHDRLYIVDPRLALKVAHRLDKGASDYLFHSPLKTSFIGIPDRSSDVRHAIAASFRKCIVEKKGFEMQRVIERAVSQMAKLDMVDMNFLTLRTTMDVLGNVLFGIDLGALDGRQERFQKALKVIVTRDSVLRNTVTDSQEFIDNSHILSEETEYIFNHCLDQANDSFIDIICKSGTLETAKTNLKVFLMAGTEIASTTVSILTHILAWRPELQKELQEEADQWIVRVQEDASLVPPKLDSAFKELLRTYPIGAYAVRQTQSDMDLGGIFIPAKSNIRVFIWGTNRSSDLWKDAKSFCPDRFMTGESHKSFYPFGAGPRICPGQHLAWVEMRLMMTYFLHHFTFRPVPQTKDMDFFVDWEHAVAHLYQPVVVGVQKRQCGC